jgi:hypothetical protein
MGTNYYVKSERCNCCDHKPDDFHIGKSSYGWYFTMHVTYTITNFQDMLIFLVDNRYNIYNEYGDKVELEDIIRTICCRSGNNTAENYYENSIYCELGQYGLVKFKVGFGCIGSSEINPIDYVPGDFC